MCQEAALGLKYLHHELEPSIVHRDVKSHNVLVGPGGEMKICDFGLVQTKVTEAGTPNYMAPELFEVCAMSQVVSKERCVDLRFISSVTPVTSSTASTV